MTAATRRLFSFEPGEERTAGFTLRLTSHEHSAIERAANHDGISMADYIRQAIKARIEANA